MIIAIDEARGLLESFDIMKANFLRVFRQAAASMSIFNVRHLSLLLEDSNSWIANFASMRIRIHDSSLRGIVSVGDLYPPFYTLSGYDLFASKYSKDPKECITAKTKWIEFLEKRNADPAEFVKLDSVLWRAFLESQNQSVSNLVSFAGLKLAPMNAADRTSPYIACLACRANLNVMPSSSLDTDLVASNMAQLNILTEARDLTFLSYHPDAVLAQGAETILQTQGLEVLATLEK